MNVWPSTAPDLDDNAAAWRAVIRAHNVWLVFALLVAGGALSVVAAVCLVAALSWPVEALTSVRATPAVVGPAVIVAAALVQFAVARAFWRWQTSSAGDEEAAAALRRDQALWAGAAGDSVAVRGRPLPRASSDLFAFESLFAGSTTPDKPPDKEKKGRTRRKQMKKAKRKAPRKRPTSSTADADDEVQSAAALGLKRKRKVAEDERRRRRAERMARRKLAVAVFPPLVHSVATTASGRGTFALFSTDGDYDGVPAGQPASSPATTATTIVRIKKKATTAKKAATVAKRTWRVTAGRTSSSSPPANLAEEGRTPPPALVEQKEQQKAAGDARAAAVRGGLFDAALVDHGRRAAAVRLFWSPEPGPAAKFERSWIPSASAATMT